MEEEGGSDSDTLTSNKGKEGDQSVPKRAPDSAQKGDTGAHQTDTNIDTRTDTNIHNS